jgi:MbtH protein
MHADEEDTTIHLVVANAAQQYSIWPADQTLPVGWRHAGPAGRKTECAAYLRDVRTDMRPLAPRPPRSEPSAPHA